MKKVLAWIGILVFLGGGSVLLLDRQTREELFADLQQLISDIFQDEKPVSPVAETEQPEKQPPLSNEQLDRLSEELNKLEADPAIVYPIPEQSTGNTQGKTRKLPSLTRSDQPLSKEIKSLIGEKTFDELFSSKFIIERFVLTIDNLPRKKIPHRQKFYTSPPGQLLVYTDKQGNVYLDPKNHSRYAHYIKLLDTIDVDHLLVIYRQYYPLFQQAYEGLGYPDKYFNDRLIEVIDHVLLPPPTKGKLRLKRPGVYYMYANPELERRSAGQKILIRMGNSHAAKLKAILRKIHLQLTGMPG